MVSFVKVLIKFINNKVFIIILIIFLCILNRYSLVSKISTNVYFNGADYYIFTWILAWDCHAIEKMHFKDFWATNAMYPYPYVLAFSENLIGLLPIAFPIWIFLHNPILTFNLTLHILLTLTAISSYLVLRKLLINDLSALIGALCFSFYPYNLWSYTIGHPHMIGLMFLPIITYFNFKYWENNRKIYLIFLGFCWLWNFLISIYIGVLLAIFLGIWNIIWFIREGHKFSLRKIVLWFIAVGIVWVVMLPIFYKYYQVVRDMGAVRTLEHQIRYTGYIWSWFVIPSDNVLWNKVFNILPASRFLSLEDAMFPGILIFVMIIVSYFVKELPVWIRTLRLTSIIIAILAIGPYTIGLSINLPLPYSLLWLIFPPLRAIRNPHRLSIFVMLGISFLIAYTINSLINRKRSWVAVSIIFLFLYCVETFTYFKTQEGLHPGLAKVYKALEYKNNPKVIIEMPMPRGWIAWVTETKPMLNSTYHWNYIFNGISGLWPPAQFQVGKELRRFPSEHTIKLLQSIGIDKIIINERRYPKGLNNLLNRMSLFPELHFEERIDSISIWHLDEGKKAVMFEPDKHLKLSCIYDEKEQFNLLLIKVEDAFSEFIFNNKAPARWKFPISEPWKLQLLDQNDKIKEEYKWDTPAIFHPANNQFEIRSKLKDVKGVRVIIHKEKWLIECS